MRSLSILFNWIFNQAFVVTFVTFLHTLDTKGTGLVSLTALESTPIAVNVTAIFLPLKLKIVSSGFNCKGYVLSYSY